MTPEFSSERSAAIRDMLLSTAVPTRRVPRVLASIGLVVAGLAVGAAVSAAAFSLTPTAAPVFTTDGNGIPAPAGTTPGQPLISILGEPVGQTTSGSIDIPLAPPPAGATHVRITVACLNPGTITWGLDPSGNNPSSSCSVDTLGTPGWGYYDIALTADAATLYVDAEDNVDAVVSYQYLNYVETAWGVNANGQTFGVMKGDGSSPDLVAVTGGYALSADLNDFGPEWPGLPSNPTEANEWQAERDAKYPNGWDVPVYDADGVTQVGTFHIGN